MHQGHQLEDSKPERAFFFASTMVLAQLQFHLECLCNPPRHAVPLSYFVLYSIQRNDAMKAIDIANWFVTKANSEQLGNDTSEGVSNLKLQKVLYFAQAAHLALNQKKSLFEDDIYAWEFGPVVESVYHDFKASKNKPIAKPTNTDFETFDENTTSFLENTWAIFGKFSAAKLVQMSHEHKPWKDAFAKEDKIITKEAIYNYYKSAFQKV